MLRLLTLLLVCGFVVPTIAQPPSLTKEGGNHRSFPLVEHLRVPTVHIEVAGTSSNKRALRYELLPSPLDLTSGNAALLWIRAGQALQQNSKKFTAKEYDWLDPDKSPLSKFPTDEVKAFLDAHSATLKLAGRAARKEICDWQFSPFTLTSINEEFPYEELQYGREIARLLSLQFRYQLSKKQYDEAAQTLQTCVVLARDVGNGDLIIQNLVGVAIGSVTGGLVEEWIGQGDSPNLYWPITILPDPVVDNRHAIRYELDTFYRTFSFLRQIEKARDRTLDKRELEELVLEVGRLLALFQNRKVSDFEARLMLTALSVKLYPDAKEELRKRGWDRERVEELPVLQVMGLYMTYQYNQWRDEFLQWSALPYWQSQPHLLEVEKKLRGAMLERGNPFLLLLPAIVKVRESGVRIQAQFATLRCVEAIRLYAASHQGELPGKLSDITDVPLPVYPFTGGSFVPFYTMREGQAVLEIPPLPGHPPVTGKRYVFRASR